MPRHTASLIVVLTALCSPVFGATGQWAEVSSAHFTVITDSSDKQGRHILDQFERMRWMFHVLFSKGSVDPALPIVVIATKNEKSFQSLEPAAYLGKGQLSLAGLFQSTPDRNYILLRLDVESEHPFSTIYHEYTHFQFRDAGEWMPLWLNEGFAEFIQNTDIHDKDVVLGEPSVDDILYLRQNRLLPLATLFKVDHNSPCYHEEEKGSVFYAESWALTHYLEMTDHAKGTHRISDYLTLVSRREDPVTAAEKAFGDLKDLQAALDDYIRLNGYREFVLNSAAAPLDEASYKSTPLTEAQADAIRADFLVYVQRIQDARTLLDAVLKSDPDNAKAHETMGYLAFRDGDREGARKWYEQAVKLDPRSPLAHYYAALLSMNGGVSPDYPEIEANLRAAIGLSPRFAPAYDQLASLFAMEHKNLDEAHMLNLQAVQLEPNSLAYRMNTATVLVTMGRYSDAVAVLRVSLGVAKGPSEVLMVQRRVKQVEAIEALGAQPNATVTTPPTAEVDIQTAEKVVDVVPEPKHPTEPADGPRHSADGTIREVQCRDPAEIAFLVETGKKPVLLYSNNFFKVDFTVVGFTPKGDLNPCKDIEGLKARVQYAESSDKTVDGQVISIELRK